MTENTPTPTASDIEKEELISLIVLKHLPRSLAMYILAFSLVATKDLQYSLGLAFGFWIFFVVAQMIIPKRIVKTTFWLMLNLVFKPIALWYPFRWVLLVVAAIVYAVSTPGGDSPWITISLVMIFDVIRIYIFR